MRPVAGLFLKNLSHKADGLLPEGRESIDSFLGITESISTCGDSTENVGSVQKMHQDKQSESYIHLQRGS